MICANSQPHLSRVKLLEHLEREKYLTARQLTVIRNQQRQFLVTNEFPQGYAGTTRLLNRVHQSKLIRKSSIHTFKNVPYFFHLPDVKAPSLQSFQHENIAGDIYATYWITGELKYWTWKSNDEYEEVGVRPDRSSRIGGKIVFWEIDRATEDLPDVAKKIPKYIALADKHQKHFHVVFSVPTKGRAHNLLQLLPPYKRGHQFLVTTHDRVLSDPLGQIFGSPLDITRFFSLSEL